MCRAGNSASVLRRLKVSSRGRMKGNFGCRSSRPSAKSFGEARGNAAWPESEGLSGDGGANTVLREFEHSGRITIPPEVIESPKAYATIEAALHFHRFTSESRSSLN